VIAAATAIAILDVFFIMVAVPESLPDKCRSSSRGLTLEQVNNNNNRLVRFFSLHFLLPFVVAALGLISRR
jgi:hypothetical protein